MREKVNNSTKPAGKASDTPRRFIAVLCAWYGSRVIHITCSLEDLLGKSLDCSMSPISV